MNLGIPARYISYPDVPQCNNFHLENMLWQLLLLDTLSSYGVAPESRGFVVNDKPDSLWLAKHLMQYLLGNVTYSMSCSSISIIN